MNLVYYNFRSWTWQFVLSMFGGTLLYIFDSEDPILIGRAYGHVSRHQLHEELLWR